MMSANYWSQELDKECKQQQKRWNGKVITTSKQWSYNDNGSATVTDYSTDKVWSAVRDYYNTREWN